MNDCFLKFQSFSKVTVRNEKLLNSVFLDRDGQRGSL